MQAESASCPICGSSSRYDFSGRNVLIGADTTRYDYYKCDVCVVFFLHPMPDPLALANLYPEDYVEADDLQRQKSFNPLKLAQL